MPFGVRNAPATFQRLVSKVLAGVSCCEVYLDDTVVYSASWDDHVAKLREVFASHVEPGEMRVWLGHGDLLGQSCGSGAG